MNHLGRALRESRVAQVAEIICVFGVLCAVVAVGWVLVGENSLARQAVVWVGYVLMLVTVWIGLRLRGQGWDHFGLGFEFPSARGLLRGVLQSILVLLVALAAFVAGSAVMMNVAGAPEGADMSSYDWLRGNLSMLLLALAGVYVGSSFGEEVLFRGFLMNRIAEMGNGARAAWRVAVVISAILFGLAHFGWGVVGIVQMTLMGLALAISYLVLNRNLWVLVLAHVYMDTLLLVPIYLD